MNVVIVEDEAPAAKRLQKLLTEMDSTIQVVGTLESIRSTVQWSQANPAPDLMFMDIQLSDGLSFEIFRQIKIESPIIFTTAYNEYALQAFKVNSIDYLLKPINTDELKGSLIKYQTLRSQFVPMGIDTAALLKNLSEQQKSFRTRFLIAYRDEFIMIPTNEIAYFYSEHKQTHLVRADGKRFAIDQTLEELDSELNPKKFFRASRQFIVSVESIASIHRYFNGKLKLTLHPPIESDLTVSRETAPAFKTWLDA
jgi:two-component system, LytTR family, response regulator LytT